MKSRVETVKSPRQKGKMTKSKDTIWDLRLYIAGQSVKGVNALNHLKVICEDQLKGKYRIKVIDLKKEPRAAHIDQILAIPTLVRKSPLPEKCIIGDLSDTERVIAGLNLNDMSM